MVRELRAAVVYLTGFGDRAALDPETTARGGAFFPVLGLALGGIAALAAREGAALVPDGGGAAVGLAALVLLVRAAPLRAVARGAGALAAVALLALELGALWVVVPSALGPSLALAGMLGRWAFVVQAYGSTPARPDGIGAAFTRAMQFREFGLASVSAMALTLLLADAVGLVLLLWTATQTIALRILVHGRKGGVGETSLAAGAALAEASTLLLCAALARLLTTG
ncbi:MAG: hypothetical protein FJ144_19870 [Deltaproteobacteria bacterium]|nr:hypothetical protein [Deltaproteobacteria bacterium]